MLRVIELDFDYQDQPLLNKISLHLPAGGLLHLRGANGAGKTTLLKLVAGLHVPSSGQILFDGLPINENLADYHKQICYVGHKTGISPYLTVRENCFFDAHYCSDNSDIVKLSAIFNLQNHLEQPCGLLSAGQRRQVSLLRLWMSESKLWLLDEPLVALDETALALIMDKIANHRSQGGAVLLTSHQNLPLSKSDYLEYCL